MIIKGNPGGNVAYWGSHLLRDDTNERAEVKEITGLLSADVPTALREMEALASGSRSHGNFMYCANINPEAHEHLTEAQWCEAVGTLEKNMGLEGHQRIVVEHEKDGRTHRHIVWNRVDAETLRVLDVGGNYYVHERTARELERRFELTPTPAPNREAFREVSQELWEIRAAERSGIDPKALKAEITELWRSTDSGQAFAAALDERGYVLAKGDRRDFCIVDQAGDAHSLARRIDGAKAHDVRERMADIDRDSLPSVPEAREQQRSKSREAERETPQPERETALPEKASGADESSRDSTKTPGARTSPHAKFLESLGQKRTVAPDAQQEAWRERRDAEVDRVSGDKGAGRIAAEGVKGGFTVVEKAGAPVVSLGFFILDFLSGGSAPQPPRDDAQRAATAERGNAALDSIRESMEKGDALKAEDVRDLPLPVLEGIRRKGDDYLLRVIEMVERDRARERERDRER